MIKKIIKVFFGTENLIFFKSNISCFLTGALFYIFAIAFETEYPSQPTAIFSCISGILFLIWIITLESRDKPWQFITELIRLIFYSFILLYSINFCINLSIDYNGFMLLLFSILSCIGILACLFYLISKFIDTFFLIKRVFQQIKQKLFNSVQPATSKAKALIENITAFLVSVAGLGIAIKAILEPLISLFK